MGESPKDGPSNIHSNTAELCSSPYRLDSKSFDWNGSSDVWLQMTWMSPLGALLVCCHSTMYATMVLCASPYKLAGFSVERLMKLLTALDQDVEIVIRRKPRSRKAGRSQTGYRSCRSTAENRRAGLRGTPWQAKSAEGKEPVTCRTGNVFAVSSFLMLPSGRRGCASRMR
jgi:hypothetical protein